jgi:hypothetical protein
VDEALSYRREPSLLALLVQKSSTNTDADDGAARREAGRVGPQRALFPCFTSTRVQILTQMTALRSEKQEEWDRRELAQLKEELQVLRYMCVCSACYIRVRSTTYISVPQRARAAQGGAPGTSV